MGGGKVRRKTRRSSSVVIKGSLHLGLLTINTTAPWISSPSTDYLPPHISISSYIPVHLCPEVNTHKMFRFDFRYSKNIPSPTHDVAFSPRKYIFHWLPAEWSWSRAILWLIILFFVPAGRIFWWWWSIPTSPQCRTSHRFPLKLCYHSTGKTVSNRDHILKLQVW